MGITATKGSGGDFVQAPEGTHIARCFGLIDLGTQHGEYEGKATVRRQVLVQWELPGEMIETDDGPKPLIISKFYTLVLSEKSNLLRDLEAWRGKKFTPAEMERFDIVNVLGAPCMLSVVKKGDRAKVGSVMAIPKGTEVPALVNEKFVFSFEDYDHGKFLQIPAGIRGIIERSDEWAAMHNTGGKPAAQPKGADFSDDIPF